MNLLAIETATEACSAALYLDGDIRLRYSEERRKHSELILGMMDGLLADAGITLSQLDAIAFANGPGAFTGIRIATGVVQGVALGADLPVIAVSTLASLSQRVRREHDETRIMAAFDARMGEIYWGCYADNGSGVVQPVVQDQITTAEEAEAPPGEAWYGAGTGWGTYGDRLSGRFHACLRSYMGDIFCSAEDVATLAANTPRQLWKSPGAALPSYLREQVAKKPSRA